MEPMLLAHAGHWFLWPLIPLFWFLLFVLFFAFVVRPRRARWLDSRRSGEAVLSERYARGEIDEAEYRRRREVLREGGAR
jgi:putative membrane protein